MSDSPVTELALQLKLPDTPNPALFPNLQDNAGFTRPCDPRLIT